MNDDTVQIADLTEVLVKIVFDISFSGIGSKKKENIKEKNEDKEEHKTPEIKTMLILTCFVENLEKVLFCYSQYC